MLRLSRDGFKKENNGTQSLGNLIDAGGLVVLHNLHTHDKSKRLQFKTIHCFQANKMGGVRCKTVPELLQINGTKCINEQHTLLLFSWLHQAVAKPTYQQCASKHKAFNYSASQLYIPLQCK